MSNVLHSFNVLYKGSVIKRPSKYIRSPYVADIKLDDTTNEREYLGHTPSLGCCGLVESKSIVYMEKLSDKTKCHYRICLSEINSKGHIIRVGVAPKLAETITYNALHYNLIQNLNVKSIAREKTIKHSRFDFIGKTHDDNYYILEVKNVPLADYEDISSKERKKINYKEYAWNNKVAYFPDGYRKHKNAPVSERAIKHINELSEIKQEYPNIRCILLFVIQRIDCNRFQPSRLDQTYLNAVRKARYNGVEIKTLQVEWREDNNCYFIRNDLPIYLFDDYNHLTI